MHVTNRKLRVRAHDLLCMQDLQLSLRQDLMWHAGDGQETESLRQDPLCMHDLQLSLSYACR